MDKHFLRLAVLYERNSSRREKCLNVSQKAIGMPYRSEAYKIELF